MAPTDDAMNPDCKACKTTGNMYRFASGEINPYPDAALEPGQQSRACDARWLAP